MKRQSGSTIIEFSLALIVFLMFLLGVTDFSRMLFTWNAANEATALGARYAVVCDSTANKADVLARMQALLPEIADIALTWNPSGCNPTTCEGVTVTVTDLKYQWISPIAGAAPLAAMAMPTFSTYLTREVMRRDPNSEKIC